MPRLLSFYGWLYFQLVPEASIQRCLSSYSAVSLRLGRESRQDYRKHSHYSDKFLGKGGWMPVTMQLMISQKFWVRAVHGALPLTISITRQPKLQISAETPCPVLLRTSGAMQQGVPLSELQRRAMSQLDEICMVLAVPKSLILSVPSCMMRMLAHLRSRCTMFCSWRCFSPFEICAVIAAASLYPRWPRSRTYCLRLPLFAYSRTISTCLLSLEMSKLQYLTMFSWFSFLRTPISALRAFICLTASSRVLAVISTTLRAYSWPLSLFMQRYTLPQEPLPISSFRSQMRFSVRTASLSRPTSLALTAPQPIIIKCFLQLHTHHPSRRQSFTHR